MADPEHPEQSRTNLNKSEQTRPRPNAPQEVTHLPLSATPAPCRGACPWPEQGYLAASAPDAPSALPPPRPRPLFRHTRALPRVSRRQRPRRPERPPTPVATSAIPAPPFPSYPRLAAGISPPAPQTPRASSRARPHLRHPRTHTSVIPALAAGISPLALQTPRASSNARPHLRPTRAPFSVIPAPCRGYLAASAPDAARVLQRPSPRSVAPNLIWGPYGGRRGRSAPSRPANEVGGRLRTPALRTALGLGPKSSLGRRIPGRGASAPHSARLPRRSAAMTEKGGLVGRCRRG